MRMRAMRLMIYQLQIMTDLLITLVCIKDWSTVQASSTWISMLIYSPIMIKWYLDKQVAMDYNRAYISACLVSFLILLYII